MKTNNPYKGATRGNLIQVFPSGKSVTLVSNQPWGVLQQEKKLRLMRGIPACQLKLTHAR
jgi:hypothetical protein